MHWMDRSNLTCTGCGKVSRNRPQEARHRHNFPFYCIPQLKECGGTNKDGSKCRKKSRKGPCRWHIDTIS